MPDGAERADAPTALIATTVNEYERPARSPVTFHASAPLVKHVRPPGLAVARYRVTIIPPWFVGARHVTSASRCPARAVAAVGGAGIVARTETKSCRFDDESANVPTAPQKVRVGHESDDTAALLPTLRPKVPLRTLEVFHVPPEPLNTKVSNWFRGAV